MKKALLVIDCINGIVDGSCKDYVAKHPVIDNINHIITTCRNIHIPIIFIRLAFESYYDEIPKHSKLFNHAKAHGRFKLGTPDTQFVPNLMMQANDEIFNKTGASPFCGNDLMQWLKKNQIEQLIFTGLATDNAINIGVREAHDQGFYTIIPEDACGASCQDFQQWSLTLLSKIANKIIDTETCIKQLMKEAHQS